MNAHQKIIKDNVRSILKIITNHYGVKYSAALYQILKEHPDFPSFLSFQYILHRMGKDSFAIHTSYEELTNMPAPFIVHGVTNVDLFLFITKATAESVQIIDEKGKEESIKKEDFEKMWDGNILIIDNLPGKINIPSKSKLDLFIKLAKYPFLILCLVALCTYSLILKGVGDILFYVYLLVLLGGLGTSILLFIEQIDKYNVHIKRLCSSTYTATITAKNGTSGIVAVSTIKFTKTLPAFPATVYPYTNILVQNNLKIYPVYNNAQAEYDMKNVWHGIAKDATGTTGYANLIFSEINSDPSKVVVDYVPASNIISAPAALVNPKDEAFGTKFPMAIHYNYGKISNKYNAKTKAWEVVDHNPAWGTDFTVEFGNYIYDCTFAWSKAAPKVTYPGAVGKSTYIAFSDLKITDWYKEALDLTKMTTSGTKENTYMKSVTLHFLTGDKYDRVDEYYECVAGATYAKYDSSKKTYTTVSDIKEATHIQLTSKSNASQGSDVPTKIQLVFTDNFNYEVDVTMNTPFTMTFQQQ